jgi:hypothetical protein
VRDAQGKFVRAYTRRFEEKPEIAEAKALGVLEALQWLHSADISNVYIEVDCLQVVQAINNKLRNNTEFDIIIDLCRSLLNLIQFVLMLIPKSISIVLLILKLLL